MKRFKPVRRQDPVFGSLLYLGDKLGYWEGRTRFPPTDCEIEIFVDGTEQDSMERQHHFFQKVCGEWPQLRETIVPKLQAVYLQANFKTLAVPPWDEFAVISISIPPADLESAEWTIGLEAKSDDAHSYLVEMSGRVPQSASWDS